jgi:chromosomal replication initiator protein
MRSTTQLSAVSRILVLILFPAPIEWQSEARFSSSVGNLHTGEVVVITCAQDAIATVQSRIAEKVGPQKYNVWFKNATRFSIADGYLHVAIPNRFVGEWIERHFADVINEAVHEVTGEEVSLSFTIDPSLARHLGKKQPDRQVDYVANNPERVAREVRRNGRAPSPQSLRGQLEEFVIGSCNQMAVAAATEVIQSPSTTYNPLFVHGGCGVGKTHLLQSVCNGIAAKHPQLRWRYVTGEEFTNDYVLASKAKEHEAFRDRYRNLDVLVIDDVHFLANKRASQEEFLHTFKAIDAANKQVVLASDAHPKLIGHFSEQLVSRFLQGMVVRIESPDFKTRAEVLRRRAAKLKAQVPEPVIQHVAEQFRANIRELDGALLKIIAQAQVMREPISLSLAERAIRDLVRHTAPVVMLADIESVVAIYFGLSPADLHTSRKTRTIALARGIAMYLARKHTDMSFPEIGRYMGNKNHSTVILANRRISKKLQANETVSWVTPGGQKERNLAMLLEDLEEQIGGPATAEAVAL